MPPVVILPPLIAIAAAFFIRKRVKKTLSGKKVMLFGPPQSGKTTFVNYLTKKMLNKEYSATGTGDYHHYHDNEDDISYDFFDMGGAQAFLKGGEMENKYFENDIILVFFNAYDYLHDINGYQNQVNAFFDGLFILDKGKKKPILFIGSYRDKLNETEQKQFGETLVNIINDSKQYYKFVCAQKFILVDMREKGYVKKILNEISK